MSSNKRICLITGGSSGLGFAVSKILAQQKFEIILLCRDEEKGKEALVEIKKITSNPDVKLAICDLASLASLASFIKDFKKQYSKLDILINNAAIMKKRQTLTEDGYEMMFQVNYLAPILLMTSLCDLLKKSDDARIINLALAYEKDRVKNLEEFISPSKYSAFPRLMNLKLGLLLFSIMFSQKIQENHIRIMCIAPGTFKSNLVREFKLGGFFKNLFSFPVKVAANRVANLASSSEIPNKLLLFFWRKQSIEPIQYWQNIEEQQKVWEFTKQFIDLECF